MADGESEQAFFQAQAMNAEPGNAVATEEQGADNDEEEYDPSETLNEHYQNLPGAQQGEDAAVVAASNPTSASDVNAGAGGDALNPSQNPSRAESQTSTPVPPAGISAQPQTRTIGGFVVEDDEEDDKDEADYEPPAALEVDDTNAMPMIMSEDPSSGNANQNTSPDVSSHPAVQVSANVLDVANSSYSPAPVPNIDHSSSGQASWPLHDASLQNSTVPTPVPDSPSASRGRLPHDRVGILQDRVDEDPRGDIAAWLELIAEHRGRNRLDSAREIYERFLKVFPMAVSKSPFRILNSR